MTPDDSLRRNDMNKQSRTQVRLPEEISEWLKHRAKTQDRSMNAEIVRILRERKEADEQEAKAA